MAAAPGGEQLLQGVRRLLFYVWKTTRGKST
jgi:hypothetical protein